MVWLDNSSGATITASISSAHTPGGATGFFAVEPLLDTFANNHWERSAKFNETAVIHSGKATVKIPHVRGDDFIVIFSDSFIQVRNAPQVYFG
ncbi:hypothetical protein PC9H_002958 [Pleurotus ostreatus]|uniref:Uncharacterized protein n=1 Tax=Pleurotus ostreatus TaxID=5322 RepID=A0A8H7DUV2_PLEOS|nr:uncharacterized protein PC9H_002958 [Pleurotus ostreatus]KAF7436132.1 hypothetical protein PC9H_002958 [Pleurotus ostreatus]KAJ8701769.1 hypothetical protein PTI98_000522 [Pleurotus ostreatus]